MEIDFSKSPDGLIPAIIQDAQTRNVLMLGYMNAVAWAETQASGKVTFFSRSKKRLWTKGEESGNYLSMVRFSVDCDRDTLLIQAKPAGPTCHTGTDTCWSTANNPGTLFLDQLVEVIENRLNNPESSSSYVRSLHQSGIHKVAQKVGEEAVELVIESMRDEPELFLGEAADLLFHYLLLLQSKGHSLEKVIEVLRQRHQSRS